MTQAPDENGARSSSSELDLFQVHVSPAQVLKYDRPCPRYTSYPTADRFTEEFTGVDYAEALRQADQEGDDKSFSIYVHLPFCDQMCTYCACNMAVAKKESTRLAYLDRLFAEMDAVFGLLKRRRNVAELHFGGGTPNFYTPAQLHSILDHLRGHFQFEKDASLSIEVDPRLSSAQQVAELVEAGLNRISYGVQDFDPDVQDAVGRIQPYAMTREVVDAARNNGVSSVNIDLIYGLPRQNAERFNATFKKVLELRPDRLALFSFAYLPKARPNQRKIRPEEIPSAEEKVDLFCRARDELLDAGYVAVGMDHFALPTDSMAQAFRAGALHRNFQGYTVSEAEDMLGFGMSAIGELSGAYAQNPRKHGDYNQAMDVVLEKGGLPTKRGIKLNADDQMRRRVIRELMCHFKIDDETFGDSLKGTFPDAFEKLRAFEKEGLVEVSDSAIQVTPLGALFVRIVASAFDHHLHKTRGRPLPYSKAI
jgi:oxygen-independent coproporphyrinogen-3 oxidase